MTAPAPELVQAAVRPGTSVRTAHAERLHGSRNVRAVFAARCAVGSRFAVAHARRRDDLGPPRVTTVAGRAVGNAVERNRVKRRLRAILAAQALPAGTDLVLVGRRAALRAPAAELRSVVGEQIVSVLGRCR